MASMRAVRSPCGVSAGMVVGVAWVVGCTALICGSAVWITVAGAGRARGYSVSSISVSLGGSGLEYWVFLVSTGIFRDTIARVCYKGKKSRVAFWLANIYLC
jgi:hypothetical protein